MSGSLFILTFAAALGAALAAGVFFIFSVCIMTALTRVTPSEGMRTMQSINRVIIGSPFIAVFMGTAVLSSAIVVMAALDWAALDGTMSGTSWAVAGSLVYLITAIGVTLACNVPLNNELDRAEPGAADSLRIWARYQDLWTKWNHVRSAGTLSSTGFFIAALT